MRTIDVVIPTVTGRELSLDRCVRAYQTNTAGWVRFWIVKDRPTCGIGWNDGADLIDTEPGDFIHFSADDLEPLPGWDASAIRAVENGHQPCPKLINPDGSVAYWGLQQYEPPEGTPVEFSTIPFMPSTLWPVVGPSLEGHYYTDNWLSIRAELAGLPSAYYPGYAFIHHHEMVKRGAGMAENDRMIHDRALYDQARTHLSRSTGAVMTENPNQDQPGPRPEPQLGVTDSPTVEQHAQMDAQGQSGELKGEALDKALEDAGLPKTGTADEKRARLSEGQTKQQ